MLSDLDTSSTMGPFPVQVLCSLCSQAIQNEENWMCHTNMQVGNGVYSTPETFTENLRLRL